MNRQILATTAEVLAWAVCDLFPQAQRIHSWVTDIGFAYDFILESPLDDETIPLIEEKMRQCIKEDHKIELIEITRENGQELLRHHGQHEKAKILANIPSNIIPMVRIGTFYDTYEEPLAPSTGIEGAFRIHTMERSAPTMFRIHGTIGTDKKALNSFLKRYEKVKKEQNQDYGNTLNLYSFENDKVVWLPQGVRLRKRIISWWENQHAKLNFNLLDPENTPHQVLRALGTRVGSFCEIFQSNEFTTPYPLFRGLLSLESETIDAAWTFCEEKDVNKELTSSLQFILKTIMMLGFEYRWRLTAKNKGSQGEIKLLKESLENHDVDYETSYCDGAPSIEVQIRDPFGQYWTGPRLSLHRSAKQVVIKRSVFGSLEKMIALLLESNQGELPLWLAPEQVRLIPLAEQHTSYAHTIKEALINEGCFGEVDKRPLSVSERVKAAIKENIPYIAVIGDNEVETETVTYRLRETQKEKTSRMDEFIAEIAVELAERTKFEN